MSSFSVVMGVKVWRTGKEDLETVDTGQLFEKLESRVC